MLFYRMQRGGISNWGFAPIIASGVNAATLHYGLTIAASSRTTGHDGRASYETIALISPAASPLMVTSLIAAIVRCAGCANGNHPLIKPGMTLGEMNLRTRELLTETTLAIGLIKEPQEIVKHYA